MVVQEAGPGEEPLALEAAIGRGWSEGCAAEGKPFLARSEKHPTATAIVKQAVSRDSRSSRPQLCPGPPNPSAIAFSCNSGGR